MSESIETATDAEETIEVIEADVQLVFRKDALEKFKVRRSVIVHLVMPLVLLFIALLGGVRFSGADGEIKFLRPPLICLVFAAGLVIMFSRAGLISLDGWVNSRFSLLQNLSNGITLTALFFASVQLFNSLLPEQGLPFWVVSFCIFWTLWSSLFAEFDSGKLVRSLTSMFVLAFVVKYLLLANLAKPGGQDWISSMLRNPGQAAATFLLDLPQFAPATGYLQFFTLALFVIALNLIPRRIED